MLQELSEVNLNLFYVLLIGEQWDLGLEIRKTYSNIREFSGHSFAKPLEIREPSVNLPPERNGLQSVQISGGKQIFLLMFDPDHLNILNEPYLALVTFLFFLYFFEKVTAIGLIGFTN